MTRRKIDNSLLSLRQSKDIKGGTFFFFCCWLCLQHTKSTLNYKFSSSKETLQKFTTSASRSEVKFRGNKFYRQKMVSCGRSLWEGCAGILYQIGFFTTVKQRTITKVKKKKCPTSFVHQNNFQKKIRYAKAHLHVQFAFWETCCKQLLLIVLDFSREKQAIWVDTTGTAVPRETNPSLDCPEVSQGRQNEPANMALRVPTPKLTNPSSCLHFLTFFSGTNLRKNPNSGSSGKST